jgi:hypothetical protein
VKTQRLGLDTDDRAVFTDGQRCGNEVQARIRACDNGIFAGM